MLNTIYALSTLLLLAIVYVYASMAGIISATPSFLFHIETFWLFAITISTLGLLVPMLISFYRNRTYLFQSQKRILYRVPFISSGIALLIGIVIAAIIYVLPSGGGGPGSDFVAAMWLIVVVPIYVISELGLSFLVSLVVYFWNRKKETSYS